MNKKGFLLVSYIDAYGCSKLPQRRVYCDTLVSQVAVNLSVSDCVVGALLANQKPEGIT
jgi:hypothetical protein